MCRNPINHQVEKWFYNQGLKRDIPDGWEVKKTISMNLLVIIKVDWGKKQEEGNYTQKVSCIRSRFKWIKRFRRTKSTRKIYFRQKFK